MKKKILPLLFFFPFFINAQNKEVSDSIEIYNPIEIKEVLIQSQRKKMFADKMVYTFDKAALDKARYAKDLLSTLPELQIDFVSNTITSTKGGKTLMLINSIEASDLQIRSVKPQDVIRVEYFDIPPTRWANRADQVVNIITKNPENGYVYGLEGVTAFNTGFVNGSLYGELTKNKHNFGLEYNLNLRDYNNRQNNNSYQYILNNDQYKTEEEQFDHFGYTNQDITLRYTNVDTDKYSFQTKLNLNILSYFANANGTSLFIKNNISQNHTTKEHNNQSYAIPTLDLYYSRKISEKDELIFNVVGSVFSNKSTQDNREWVTATNVVVFDNQMNLKTNQTSIVGEIVHSHRFEKGTLSSGIRTSNNHIKNNLTNLLGSFDYSVNYLENYLYTEYSGKADKLSYRLGVGLTNINNKSATTNDNDWTITPKLVLGYELTKKQTLRLTSSYKPTSPWAEALSDNVIQFVPNIVRKGNPYLKSQKQFNNSLIYSVNTKYFDLNTAVNYSYVNKAINQYFVFDNELDLIALTYENANYYQTIGARISGSVKPFGTDLLDIKLVVSPISERLKTSKGTILKNNALLSSFVLSSVYKNFKLHYQFNIPTYRLDGAFLNTNENQNNIFLSYKQSNLTFTAGMFWIGMPSEYKTKSLDASLVNYRSHTQIWNNKNMFVLGFSYDFSTGKKINLNKKLNNNTAGAVGF